MTELDEKALAKAAQAVGVDMWRVPANPATIARAAVTAYLAAARPTPDAAAMEREFRDVIAKIIDAIGLPDELDYAVEDAVLFFRKAVSR